MTPLNRSCAQYGMSPIRGLIWSLWQDEQRRRELAQMAVDMDLWSKEVAEAVYRIKLDTDVKGNEAT